MVHKLFRGPCETRIPKLEGTRNLCDPEAGACTEMKRGCGIRMRRNYQIYTRRVLMNLAKASQRSSWNGVEITRTFKYKRLSVSHLQSTLLAPTNHSFQSKVLSPIIPRSIPTSVVSIHFTTQCISTPFYSLSLGSPTLWP